MLKLRHQDSGATVVFYLTNIHECSLSLAHLCAGKDDLLTSDVEKETRSSSKASPCNNRYSMSTIRCYGVDLTPDTVAVAMVYFVQGVLGLARLAVSFYLKDNLHLDPAEVCSLFKKSVYYASFGVLFIYEG